MTEPNVTVFYETGSQPDQDGYVKAYPEEIGAALAAPFRRAGIPVTVASFGDDGHTLTPQVLAETQVMLFWMHLRQKIDEELVEAIKRRVREGMGLVVLHSAVGSSIFQHLVGCTAAFTFRNVGERERVWVIDRGHPLAAGLGPYIDLQDEEMYGEEFDIPAPDDLVFISWFEGGEVIRSGCVWKRGRGKVFYFRPGHETAPTYHNPDVQQVLVNAARWLAQAPIAPPAGMPMAAPPEAPHNLGLAKLYEAWKDLPVPMPKP